MYAPCPPRPKKTSIIRTRTGCYTCRRRRRKCDEAKPECERCLRQGLTCEGYATRFSFLDTTSSTQRRVEEEEARKWAAIRERDGGANLTTDSREVTPTTTNAEPKRHRGSLAESQSTSSSISLNSDLDAAEEGNISTPSTEPISSGIDRCLDTAHTPWSKRKRNSTQQFGSVEAGRFTVSPFRMIFPFAFDQSPDSMYLLHFNKFVLTLLPSTFIDINPVMMDFEVPRTAALALAALSISRLEASSAGDLEELTPTALSQEHSKHAIKYYDSALRLLAASTGVDESSLVSRLVAMLLFAYFEWESQSPPGFFAHISGADALVTAEHVTISSTNRGRQLLSCWAALHARKGIHKLPFRPLELEEEKASTSSNAPDVRILARSFAKTSHDKILTILGDSFRMYQRIVLERCMCSGDEDLSTTMRKAVEWYGDRFAFPFTSEEQNKKDRPLVSSHELMHLLNSQRSELDRWHDNLTTYELPTETFTSEFGERAATTFIQTSSSSDGWPGTSGVYPLKFCTHNAAMTYLFYSMTQLILSKRSLELCALDPDVAYNSSCQDPRGPINPWAHLTLRIIAGLGYSDWMFQEPYHVGIFWTLLTCCSACPDVRFTHYILRCIIPRIRAEAVLNNFRKELDSCERLIAVLHDQICAGRLPLATMPHHKVETNPFTSVDTEACWVAIHGRVRGGELFSDYVKIY